MSTEAQDKTIIDPDVVIIDDLSDFEDLEHELQANIIKLEPAPEAEDTPVPIVRDAKQAPTQTPKPVPYDSETKLVRFISSISTDQYKISPYQ